MWNSNKNHHTVRQSSFQGHQIDKYAHIWSIPLWCDYCGIQKPKKLNRTEMVNTNKPKTKQASEVCRGESVQLWWKVIGVPA